MSVLTRDPATFSPLERWLSTLPPDVDRKTAVTSFLRASGAQERQVLMYAWNALWARPNQRLPDGDWDTWFIRAGRGYGKTRTGAEGVRKLVNDGRARAVTIIGKTAADARDVMIEDPRSGLLAVHPKDTRPTYEPSKRLLEWPNGAIGHVRTAEDPDSVIGLNSELVWGDEPAAWRFGERTWDNAMLGNRVGTPHSILTGTPRPLPWLRALEGEPRTVVSTGSTYENIGNLAAAFIRLILGRYEGTRLGAQELHARYLDDVEGALWRMATLEANRIGRWDVANPWGSIVEATTLDRRLALGLGAWAPAKNERRRWEIWVGVDPPGETAECGIIVATAPERGRADQDHCVILDDLSTEGPPEVWGPRVVEAYRKWNANGVVVEKNQGGDMCRSTIHNADATVIVEKISAVGSKYDRAEPVSMLDAKGWIHHYGHFPELENQQTTWVKDESDSPDRLDARVHVVAKLLRQVPIRSGRVGNPLATSGARAA